MASSTRGFLRSLLSRRTHKASSKQPEKSASLGHSHVQAESPQLKTTHPPSRIAYTLELALDTLPTLATLAQKLGCGIHKRDPRFEFLVRIETAAYVLQEHLLGIRQSQQLDSFAADITALADFLERLFIAKGSGTSDGVGSEEKLRAWPVPWPRLSAVRQSSQDPQDSELTRQLLYDDLASLSTIDWRTSSHTLTALTNRFQTGALDSTCDQVLPKPTPDHPLLVDWDFKELVTDALAAIVCICQGEPGPDVRFRLGTYKKSKGSGCIGHVTVLANDRRAHAESWIEMRLHAAVEFEPHRALANIRFSLPGDDASNTSTPVQKYPIQRGACVCHCLRRHFRPHYWRLNIQIENHRLARFWQDQRALPSDSLQNQITLRTLLSPQGSELPSLAGMTLSVMLAYSLFYLFGEPSVEGRWNRDNIVFYGDGASIPLRPFLKVNHQKTKGKGPDEEIYLRYPEFLELGVMLLEIYFRNSLEVLLGLDSDIETADECLAAASQVYQTRKWDISQPGLRQAVQSCLSLSVCGEFYQGEAGNEEPTNDMIRMSLFESVVQPLERDLKGAFEGLISTDSLDEEASRKILLPYPSPNPGLVDSSGVAKAKLASVFFRETNRSCTQNTASSLSVTPVPLRATRSPSPGDTQKFTVFNVNKQATNSSPSGCAWTDDWIERFQSIVYTHIPMNCTRLKVAVLDTGIDTSHPDFDDDDRLKELRSWVGSAATVDKSGHGTHIVSTILSLTRNVDVYVAKISEGNTLQATDQIVEAIRVATHQWNVDIISLSFGFPGRLRRIQDEIQDALHAGKTFFAAASNDGGNAGRTFPGNQDGVLCIHSTDGLGNASLFNPTALNNTDNFSVVGENINAAWPRGSPHELGGTRRMTGTSFAVPVAVAVAALMIGFVSHKMPEHVNWAIPLKTPAGIRAVFRSISERRNGQYDLVNPVKVFGGGTEAELQKILGDIQAKLR